MLAIVAGAIGAEGIVQASRTQSRIGMVQADLRRLQSRVSATERGTASEREHLRAVAAEATNAEQSVQHLSWQLESAPSETELARVRAALSTYTACISQLQSEIAGLEISWSSDPAHPSAASLKLFTRAPASASCSRR